MTDTIERFARRQRVQAAVDLPGVPAGTMGRVMSEAGLTWIRYFVQFDNGVELSSIDAAKLRRAHRRR